MPLRISINAKRIEAPYGGGNRFCTLLEENLQARGCHVFRQIAPKLDLIFILAAERQLAITAYDLEAIGEYVTINPNTAVVLRVNSCDEARGADLGCNRQTLEAGRMADHAVFVSEFIRRHYVERGFDPATPDSVILTGSDERIFNPGGRAERQGNEKLKIVTHHWSANLLKGFDIYQRLDELLATEPFRDLFEFTYIGRLPLGMHFSQTRVLPTLDGVELARALKEHHLYVSAARYEAAGNHYIEAMRCGLPVLYLRSGSLPEYCAPYGVEFTLTDFEEKLLEIRERYPELRGRVLACPYGAAPMLNAYWNLFQRLVSERRANPRPAAPIGARLRHAARLLGRKIRSAGGKLLEPLRG